MTILTCISRVWLHVECIVRQCTSVVMSFFPIFELYIQPLFSSVIAVLGIVSSTCIIVSAYLTPSVRGQVKFGMYSLPKIVIQIALCEFVIAVTDLFNLLGAAYYPHHHTAFCTATIINSTLRSGITYHTHSYMRTVHHHATLRCCRVCVTVVMFWTCLTCYTLRRMVLSSLDVASLSAYQHRIQFAIWTYAVVATIGVPYLEDGYGYEGDDEGVPRSCKARSMLNLIIVVLTLIVSMCIVLYTYAKIRKQLMHSYGFAQSVAIQRVTHTPHAHVTHGIACLLCICVCACVYVWQQPSTVPPTPQQQSSPVTGYMHTHIY